MTVVAQYYTRRNYGRDCCYVADESLRPMLTRLTGSRTIDDSDRAELTGIFNHFGIVLLWQEIPAPKK